MRSTATTGGYSLIELMIVVTVLATIAVIGMRLVVRSNEAQQFAGETNRATELCQRTIGDLERDLSASAALYANDAIGNAYRGILDLPAEAPPLDSTVLPTIDTGGIFEMEASSGVKSGNALLFAREAWTTDYRCASGNELRIDVYRMEFYYLTRVGKGPRPGSAGGVTLCRYVSEPMADADQVDAVTDPADLADLLGHLAGGTPGIYGEAREPVQLVWRRHDDPAVEGTLRQIDPKSGTLSVTPLAPRTAPWRLLADPRQTSVGMLTSRHFGVASNYAPRSFGVGTFSVIDNTGDGFPHGLEVQVIGPSFNRQVLVALSIASTRGLGPKAHSRMRSELMLPVR